MLCGLARIYVCLCALFFAKCLCACVYACLRAADALHVESTWVGFPFLICTRAGDEDANKPQFIRSPEMDTSVKEIQQPPDREAVSLSNSTRCRFSICDTIFLELFLGTNSFQTFTATYIPGLCLRPAYGNCRVVKTLYRRLRRGQVDRSCIGAALCGAMPSCAALPSV